MKSAPDSAVCEPYSYAVRCLCRPSRASHPDNIVSLHAFFHGKQSFGMSRTYNIGDKASFSRQFDAQDVETFARISADDNPIHTDEDFAAASIFGKRVVHGIFTVSMFSKIFGTIYPGNGGIYLSQNTRFLRPVFVGDSVTAEVELIDFQEEKRIGTFSTRCINGEGKIVADGEAKIKMP